MNKYLYLSIQDILFIHDDIIKRSWGALGVLNHNELEKTTSFVRNDNYYEFFYQKVAYLLFSIVMNHPFIDANKRTALFSTAHFIYINTNNKILTNAFIREYEKIVVQIAEGIFNRELLEQYTENFINKYEIDESPLLEVYRALMNNGLWEEAPD